MFDKHVKIVTVDKDDKVEVIASAFKYKLIIIIVYVLFFVYISISFIFDSCVVTTRKNLLQMDIEALNNYINQDKAEMVYNYIQENDLLNYMQLEEIDGIGPKTVQKLEKYTYIKEVD